MGFNNDLLIVVATIIPVVFCGQAVPCEDLDTTACVLFQSKLPGICSDPTLSASCQRFCGLCPLVCYDCPVAVNATEDCNDTKACGQDEICMLKEHSVPGIGKEFIMSCEKKPICEGLGAGFHNLIGKRDVYDELDESRDKRDLNFHCCDTDHCNYPVEFSTTPAYPTNPTTPITLPPTVTPLNNCSKDVVFLLDGSSTIGQLNHIYMKLFVQRVISYLHIGPLDNLVAMVEYSGLARVEWYLSDKNTSRELLQAVARVPYVTGSTATHAGFWLIRNSVLTTKHGDRSNTKDVVVVITDGGTDIPDLAVSEANMLHNTKTDVLAIGVGNNVNEKQLRQMVAPPTNYFHAVSYQTLINLAKTVSLQLCK